MSSCASGRSWHRCGMNPPAARRPWLTLVSAVAFSAVCAFALLGLVGFVADGGVLWEAAIVLVVVALTGLFAIRLWGRLLATRVRRENPAVGRIPAKGHGTWPAPRRTRIRVRVLVGLVALSIAPNLVFLSWGWLAEGHGAVVVVVAFVLMLGAICLAIRVASRATRTGVTITPQQVVITGYLRTIRVPVAEATGFAVGLTGEPMIALRRDEREPVNIWPLSRGGFIWNRRRLIARLKPLVDELNQGLSDAKAAAPR
jgi:hypothetical protein